MNDEHLKSLESFSKDIATLFMRTRLVKALASELVLW
jgi:hypothetical protein